jgi:phage terminase large subunit GpA-like protein
MTVSQWADANRVLTTESSAEAGPWRTDRAEYQREIMDSIETWEEVAIMASAQVGKTEFLLNVTGSYIDQEPCPIMHVLPNEDLIQAYSKKRLTPMINNSEVLRSKVGVAKSRDSSNTIEEKSFPGGYVTIVGANAPSGLSSRPVQLVLCDEVDRFPVSSGKEGDPISLATARTKTFKHKRRHLFVSTPVDKETSRIYQLYTDSTMEEWCLPCPHCGELQPLRFKNGIKYDHYTSESGEIVVTKAEHVCSYCGALGSEKEWKRGKGAWIAQKDHSTRRGFHINQLSSPWSDWREVAKAFLIAKREGVDKLKVFVNTVLGEPWETKIKGIDEKTLAARRENYEYEVPEGVKLLTAAIDTQDDRFEVDVIGWGAGKESWRIEYIKIFGDLNRDEVWQRLDEFLCRTWMGADGREFRIVGAFMDSGGHYTSDVYTFTKARNYRHIYAIKGVGKTAKTAHDIAFIAGTTKTQNEKAILVKLGVDDGKVKVQDSLKVTQVGPQYCHFPIQPEKGYNEEYFLGLTSETQKLVTQEGVKYKAWVKIRDRNEPFDLAVYNRAVIEMMRPNLSLPLEQQPNGPIVKPRGISRTARPPLKKKKKRNVSSSI